MLLLVATWIALVMLLHSTATSMVAIWDSSETYAHGYVVLPISLWLIWRRRDMLATLTLAPDYRALVMALALAAAWLFGSVAGAQVVDHYALVGLMVTAVWALLGWRVVWELLFPLAFLFMMVPVGEFMIAPLMNFTADFTVMMVRAVGIPVFREGTYFSLPSGEWSVVSGCSGIRYFLASVVLGWLFAYLTYRTWWKRLAFGIAALIVPIIANGFRATMIVLIAHYSDMKLALGVDHFIYGWVWFGVVMLAMFWIGNIWREDEAPVPIASASPSPAAGQNTRFLLVAGILLAMVAASAWYEGKLDGKQPAPSPLSNIGGTHDWQTIATPVTNWRPRWLGMDDERTLFYAKGDDRVMLFLGWYGTQRQTAELINVQNLLVKEKHPEWRKPTEAAWSADIGGQTLSANRALLDSRLSGQHIVALQWNRLSGDDSTNIFLDKFELAWRKLLGMRDAGAVIIVATPYKDRPEEADATLKRFLADMRPSINQALDQAEQ